MGTVSFLAPGARVVIRDEEWMVKGINEITTGGYALRVVGLSELVRYHEAIFVSYLDEIKEMRPEDTAFVLDPSPQYRRSRLFLESLLRKTPPTGGEIYIGHQGAFNHAEYQLKPAHLALNNLRPRILIADGVGLGKTIEVGILLSELIKRGRGERILVVAIKSMLAQFQQELWSRFTIPLVRLDSLGLQRVRNKIPANKNPFYYYNRAIISVDTLKNDGQYRHFLEQCHWDVIVVDECHNVANANTQRNRLASLLARTCDSLVLTSATPHNGKPESFAQLINMLEPTAIANEQEYTKDDIQGLFTRRFKKDIEQEVQEHFSKREVFLQKMAASPPEEAFFDFLENLKFTMLDGPGKKNPTQELLFKGFSDIRGTKDTLFKNTLFKAFLSSPQACLHTVQNRIDKIIKKTGERPGLEDYFKEDLAKLRQAEKLLLNITERDFSKLQYLLKFLKNQLKWTGGRSSPRAIIFSERIQTLEYLKEQITDYFKVPEGAISLFHAGLPDIEQQAIVENFGKGDAPVRLMLASDVASQGVNLHYYCHHMIHFDIPWSLITLEQRNGRIDRYGQENAPIIYYLLTVAANTAVKGDLRIIEKLIEKEQEAHKNIGDADTILNLYDVEKENQYIEESIARGKTADEIFSDQPEEDDLFDLLLGAEEETAKKYLRGELPSLYKDDISFVRDAFEELISAEPDLKTHYDPHPNKPSFTFIAPEDLQERLQFMPREAIPGGWKFLFTADRLVVQQSISEARKKENEWPAYQLLWEQHPIFSWLVDKVLVKFQRHEAPVIFCPGLVPGQSVFLFQGINSNKRAQPVIASWFGVSFKGWGNPEILTLWEAMELTRLRQGINNTARAASPEDKLRRQVRHAVESARDYMNKLRQERAADLQPAVTKDQRKLKKWFDLAMAEVKSYEQKRVLQSGKLPKDVAERCQRKRRELEQLKQARLDWLNKSLASDASPYLRIAAVFCGLAEEVN